MNEFPGVAQLVARQLWENTPSRIKNSITGCSAVGSAPALGAGCRRFESCHSDHLSLKSRLFRRFFCVKSLFFSFARPHFNHGQRGKMAIITAVQKNYENRQIPNPSLIGIAQVFSPQIRRKLEFSSIIPYNDSTVSLCATKAAVRVYSRAVFFVIVISEVSHINAFQ